MDFRGCSAVVTGGSRGLGLPRRPRARVARAPASPWPHGTRASSSGARLDLEERGIDVTTVVCDVANSEEARELIEGVVARTGGIDVLVNNAGVIKVGPLEHMQREDFERAMDVHFWGPLQTMTAAIPTMRRQRAGRIVNVSSIGGRIGVPHLAPYCASKFALAGVSDSMRAEIAKDGIFVTTVCPGMMRTGSPFNAWFKGRHRDEFAWFAISDSLPIASVDARRAALQIVDACRQWRCGTGDFVAGQARRDRERGDARGRRARHGPRQPAAATGPDRAAGDAPTAAGKVSSDRAPSRLTRLTERAARENNELPH